jgi:hypothetical protein
MQPPDAGFAAHVVIAELLRNTMELGIHTMSDLFEQLGLPSDEESMTTFIATHRTTAVNFTLPDVAIWTPAQAKFLREAIAADADWAIPAEQLSQALGCGIGARKD